MLAFITFGWKGIADYIIGCHALLRLYVYSSCKPLDIESLAFPKWKSDSLQLIFTFRSSLAFWPPHLCPLILYELWYGVEKRGGLLAPASWIRIMMICSCLILNPLWAFELSPILSFSCPCPLVDGYDDCLLGLSRFLDRQIWSLFVSASWGSVLNGRWIVVCWGLWR